MPPNTHPRLKERLRGMSQQIQNSTWVLGSSLQLGPRLLLTNLMCGMRCWLLRKFEDYIYTWWKCIIFLKQIWQGRQNHPRCDMFNELAGSYCNNSPKPNLTLQWRHNERHGVSNHRQLHCLINRMLRRTSKLCVTGPLSGDSTGDRWIPS